MSRLNIYIILFALVAVIFSGCVKNNFDEPNNNGCVDEALQRNIAIKDLKALFSGTAITIDQDLIIEGVVTSDDQNGNFYKSLVIQDEDAGILLIIDQNNLYTSFPVGRKVYVKLNGLAMDDYGGLIQIGGAIDPVTGDLQRIPQSLVNDYIFKGPCNQTVDTLKLPINQLNANQHQSMLVQLQGVRMDNNDAGLNYANPNGTSSTNRTVLDCNGSSLIMRTSDFASFAGTATPTGPFDVTGVFTVFNSDFQLGVRTLADVNTDGSTGCPCIETIGTVSGNTSFQIDKIKVVDASATTLLDEDFQSVSSGSKINLTGWKNISEAGTKDWYADQYQGETSARGTAYNSGQSNVIIWLITKPITITGNGETLSFLSKDIGAPGAALEVLISSDYNGSNNPENSTWEKICPIISSGSSSWSSSGNTDISSFTGTIYIAFRYKGGE